MSQALSGLRAWLIQRLSAVYLALFCLYLLLYFLFNPPASHADWLAWLRHPLVIMGWGVFFVALLLHAWVGLRDVILDYIHPLPARLAALAASAAALIGCGVWAAVILLGGGA
jgi:succinate dehydrogenase / fumarate reductase membrane anchor subunit